MIGVQFFPAPPLTEDPLGVRVPAEVALVDDARQPDLLSAELGQRLLGGDEATPSNGRYRQVLADLFSAPRKPHPGGKHQESRGGESQRFHRLEAS